MTFADSAAGLQPRLTPGEATQLEHTWRDPSGIVGWFAAINHKTISLRFMVTTFIFFIAGGLLAAVMRLQLARPDNDLVGPDMYSQRPSSPPPA
jgi:cytochrome c oxidase subunit I+III